MGRSTFTFLSRVGTILLLVTGLSSSSASATDSAWGDPVLIEADDSSTTGPPEVAVDADGNAVAVWVQDYGSHSSIWANRFVRGIGWGTPVALVRDYAVNIQPRVAMDTMGEATVVWMNCWRLTCNTIYEARFVPGVGWSPPTPLIKGQGWISLRDVAVDGKGNIIVVGDGGPDGVWAIRFSPGTGWGAKTQIGDGVFPRLAVNLNGSAVAVWESSGDTVTSIRSNRFAPDSGWGTPVLIESDDAWNASHAEVEMDATGGAFAVWRRWTIVDNTFLVDVWANRFESGVGWGVATPLETNKRGGSGRPEVVVDRQGNALAMWYTCYSGAEGALVAHRYVVGVGWGPETVIAPGDRCLDYGQFVWYEAGIDSSGNVLLAYTIETVAASGVYAAPYRPGSGWSRPELIEGNRSLGNSAPSVAVDPGGGAVVVWSSIDSSADPLPWGSARADIWANSLLVPLAQLPYVPLIQPPQDNSEALENLRDALTLANESIARLSAYVLGLFILLVASVAALAFLMIRFSRGGNSGGGLGILRAPSIGGASASSSPLSMQERAFQTEASGSAPSPPVLPSAPSHGGRAHRPPMASMRLTAKERVLLHLARYGRFAEELEVPRDLTQEGIATAAGIDHRHFSQYIGPLERDGLVRERTAHVRNGHQRRRIYELTDAGRRVALRLIARAKSEVVPVWDGENIWDIRVGEILEKLKGKVSVLDVARHLAEAGVVDFAALGANSENSTSKPPESEKNAQDSDTRP